jgi:hypothetical protein
MDGWFWRDGMDRLDGPMCVDGWVYGSMCRWVSGWMDGLDALCVCTLVNLSYLGWLNLARIQIPFDRRLTGPQMLARPRFHLPTNPNPNIHHNHQRPTGSPSWAAWA